MLLNVRHHCEHGGMAGPVAEVVNHESYRNFLDTKKRHCKPLGFACDQLNDKLFDWQSEITRWALLRGRAALFEDCGLGKTLQQLEWARHVHDRTKQPVLIHCPIGVRRQTEREAGKFGIECEIAVVNQPEGIIDGINLINYEKLHLFDTSLFGGVVLDESSILKSYTGQTKRMLLERYQHTPYRLACTATPAPNDIMELGNHCEFLGVMPSNEMLSRWFINDSMRAGGYRLKGHARESFWEWVATWAVAISKPSDLGYGDEGFILPALNVREHVVIPPSKEPEPGMLFDNYGLSATNVHKEKRRSAKERAGKVAELVAEVDDYWVIWCDTNYEADELKRVLPDAVEVRGSEPDKTKESKLDDFSQGNTRLLISKPEIAGFGMNWQHACNVAFVGLSYSFERYYQAVRRSWRFGQTRPVNVHIISTDAEAALSKAVRRKERQHEELHHGLSSAVSRYSLMNMRAELSRDDYLANKTMELPSWL